MSTIDQFDPGAPPQRRGRSRLGWAGLIFGLILATVFMLLPSPYVIARPGPVYDTLGEVVVDGEVSPLISIPVQETYPTEGVLGLLTVSRRGTRESPARWYEAFQTLFDSSQELQRVEDVFPDQVTDEQVEEENRINMENSQTVAIAAALTQMGYELTQSIEVASIVAGTPADGLVEAGDAITAVDGQPVTSVDQLRRVIAEAGAGSEVGLTLVRAGSQVEQAVPVVTSTADQVTPVIGVVLSAEYEFPFEVEIMLPNVGGPSAGLMFALGIIDKLTPGPLTGGQNVVGTGTITADGQVGPIGGVRQKMFSAVRSGASWFFASSQNCDEIVGHVPEGLTVITVDTLDEALQNLEQIRGGTFDTAAHSVCSG